MASDNEATTPSQEGTKEEEQAAPSPADSRSEEGEARSDDSPRQDGEEKEDQDHDHSASTTDAPPLPDEPLPGTDPTTNSEAPPLPSEAPPQQTDDGWSAEWDAANQRWYFYNRYTGVSQWDNPRVPTGAEATPGAAPSFPSSSTGAAAAAAAAAPISQPTSIAGGYNPAIHGSWDPNAPYAQAYRAPGDGDGAGDDEEASAAELAAYDAEMMALDGGEGEYLQTAAFNRGTGRAQAGDQGPERHSDAAKSYRQMNAYFNVDQAANSHDGRSLKAERRGKQPTKKELTMWKEKRKARKEEKRRAWLRD